MERDVELKVGHVRMEIVVRGHRDRVGLRAVRTRVTVTHGITHRALATETKRPQGDADAHSSRS